ncbi:MAG: ABC transporter permease [Roseiflexaceae bacterium]|nr:ABC transporter permease [Roseiflexaceae bacterium]
MFRPIIRLFAFFSKEVREIVRQPRLILSLLLGPFLILLLFGVGYQGERPKLRTALIVPAQGVDQAQLDALKKSIGLNFTIETVDSDLNGAMARLQAGQIEVVEVIPPQIQENLIGGKQSQVDFQYNQINPVNEQWIRYLAYAQVNEMNRFIQTQAITQMQTDLKNRGVESTIPPEVLAAPVMPTYRNLQGTSLAFMTFYAPGVMALMIQHIAVTLGALSLVRERLLGAVELFQVAPVSFMEVLLGKYLGYTLIIGVMAAALISLLVFTPLAVPFLGSIIFFAVLILLFTAAALGIGFMISVWSTSDSQAIQLSMLVLLMSMFFSGFFLPLENFTPAVQLVGFALPLTHAINGFQNIMLRGTLPADNTWILLAIIASVTFLLAVGGARWRFLQVE